MLRRCQLRAMPSLTSAALADPTVLPSVLILAVAAVAGALAASGAVWGLLRAYRPALTATGRSGLFAVFGQALDAVSTLVGVDVLAFTERVTASRAVLEAAGALPTAPALGTGWLFVLVKLGLAVAVLALVRPELDATPARAKTLLLMAGTVGLVPGVSNLLRFPVA